MLSVTITFNSNKDVKSLNHAILNCKFEPVIEWGFTVLINNVNKALLLCWDIASWIRILRYCRRHIRRCPGRLVGSCGRTRAPTPCTRGPR